MTVLYFEILSRLWVVTVDLTQNETGETFSTPNQLDFLMSRRNLETLRVFQKVGK